MNSKIAPVSCAEAQELSTKAEYKVVGFWDKWKLQLHLFFCRNCKKYHRQNRKLTGLLKKSKVQTCSETEKKAFQDKMMEHQSNCRKKDKKT